MGAGDTDDAATPDPEAVERLLVSGDVVEETADGADLRLTAEFEALWYERIEQIRGGDRAIRWLAASHGIDPDDLAIEDGGESFVVTHDGETLGQWPSRAAFYAELVAEPALNEWVGEERLAELPEEARTQLSVRLLPFLERCPLCENPIEFAEEPGPEEGSVRVSVDCSGCGATMFEGQF